MRRNYETTPKKSRLSMSSCIYLEEDGEDDERGRSPTPTSRLDETKTIGEEKDGVVEESKQKMMASSGGA